MIIHKVEKSFSQTEDTFVLHSSLSVIFKLILNLMDFLPRITLIIARETQVLQSKSTHVR